MSTIYIYDKSTGKNYTLECKEEKPKYLISSENKHRVHFDDNLYSNMFQGCLQIDVDNISDITSELRSDCTLTYNPQPDDPYYMPPFDWSGGV